MSPGDTQTVEVDLANQGTGSGELTLAPGSCSATDGSGNPATHDGCGQFLVSVSCDNDFQAGPAPLSSFAGGDIGTLDAGDSVACTFEVSLPNGTPSEYASETVSQPLTWTLTAAGA